MLGPVLLHSDSEAPYPFLVQLHGEVPVEAAPPGVVADPQVLPDPALPDPGHGGGVTGVTTVTGGGRGGLGPLLEDPEQLVNLLELQRVRN